MSDRPADLPAFSASATLPLGRELASSNVIAAVGVGAIVAFAATDAALRGPWLDEFWTLHLSDSRDGLLELVRDGWLRDTHPPLFNAWSTLLASLGVNSIPFGRLVTNLLAAALLFLAAGRLARREPGQAGYVSAFLLLALSLPQAMESFAVWRSYFWQMAATGVLALVARHVASARSDLGRREIDLAAVAVLATGTSIMLHYVGGLFGGLLAGAIAICAFAKGLRRWATLMLVTAALSSMFVLASLVLQAPNWVVEFDHSWIDLPVMQALAVLAALAVTPLLLNPVPLLGFFFARGSRDDSERLFVVMIAGVLVLGASIVLAVHVVKPIVVDRYLFPVPVLFAALMALPAARFAHLRLPFALLALTSVAVAAAPLVEKGIRPLWYENARTIGSIVAGCPSTQVYAASGWALGPAAETRAAKREDPVFRRAYEELARRHGFPVSFIGQDERAEATPGVCPVLLWYEHSPNDAEDDIVEAVTAAGLGGLRQARLSVMRSATGFVVRADR